MFDLRASVFSKIQSLLLIKKKIFYVYLFLRERERQSMSRGGAERERERETQNPKQAPGSELLTQSPTWGSNPRIVRS